MEVSQVATQEQAVALLDGWAEQGKEDLDAQRIRRPLVKTYMFEHSEKHFGPSLGRALEKSGIVLQSLKGDMFKVWDSHERKYVGFLERLVDRHPVVYTIEESKVTDRWAKKLVHRNPAIDR